MGKCVLKTEFQPLKFEITIENEEELKWLWHAFNCNNYGKQGQPSDFSDVEPPNGNVESLHFWVPVDSVVRAMGLYKNKENKVKQ